MAQSISVTVLTSSTPVLPENDQRKRAVFTNDSANDIYLNITGGAAVLGTGIYLAPHGGAFDDNGDSENQPCTAIARTASSNLCVAEF